MRSAPCPLALQAAQRIVVLYFRGLYAPTMSVFTQFYLQPSDMTKVKTDSQLVRDVLAVFVPEGNRFFKKRLAPKLKVFETLGDFLSLPPPAATEAFRQIVAKRRHAALFATLDLATRSSAQTRGLQSFQDARMVSNVWHPRQAERSPGMQSLQLTTTL